MRAARSVAMLALGCCWAAVLEELEVSLDGAPAYFDSVASDDTEALQTKALAFTDCLLYTSPSPRDYAASRMPSSA